MTSGSFLFLIFHGRIENRHLLSIGIMDRNAAFRSRDHQILDPHVRECSARHHPIIAAPRAVAVEIFRLDSARLQILAGGEVALIAPAGEM